MADESFDPIAAGAVALEPPFDPTQHGAIPVQPPQQGGVLSGIAAGLGRALNPVNLIKGVLDVGQPSDLSQIIKYGKTLGEIVTGKSPDEAIGQNIPELQQQRQAVFGQLGGREQAAALTGIGLQLGMVAAPLLHGALREAPLAEVAGTAKPDIAQPTVPVATDTAVAETKAAPVAPEIAQPVPEAQPAATAPTLPEETFPSLLQSAEETRRQTLNQGGETSAVQEPSTGEILQREPQETGAPGGERAGVEQGVQGQETAQTRPEEVAQTVPQPEQPVIPEGAKANVTVRDANGEPTQLKNVDAKDFEDRFIKEKSSYQKLMECLG